LHEALGIYELPPLVAGQEETEGPQPIEIAETQRDLGRFPAFYATHTRTR
jgi:hypothetical protein